MTEKAKTQSKDVKESSQNSYIISFYTETQILVHNYTILKNIYKELEAIYKIDDASTPKDDVKFTDTEMGLIKQTVSECSISIEKTYIYYLTVIKILNQDKAKDLKEDEELKKSYKKIEGQYILNKDDLRDYVIHLNAFIGSNVMSDLFKTQSDKVNALYDE